jgi:nucleotide-binding universal stress UspA family protein
LAKNILLPVDGSPFMERNINYACDLVVVMKAKLTLIHAVVTPAKASSTDPLPLRSPLQLPTPVDQESFRGRGVRILQNAKNVAEDRGVDAEILLETASGNPAEKIIEVAEEKKIDLIIIGSRGHGLLRNVLIGSVCNTVINHSPCPVLAVR